MTELTVPPGRGATLALFELISKAKAGDQLRPVTVVVPSSYVGLTFRRLLPFLPAGAPYFQDGSSRSGRGLVNVSFLTARHLGDELGLAGLCGDQRAPLTFQVWLAAARSVLADPPASLAEIAEHPSTAEALAHAFSELEGCSLTAVQTLSRRDGRGAAVARSYLETLAMLEPYFYSKRDELGAIGDLVKEEAGRLFLSRTLGQMILFAPGQLSWMERQTMHSLQLASRSTQPDHEPQTVRIELPSESAIPPFVQLTAASDPDREVRLALERSLGLSEKAGRPQIPLWRQGVLYPRHGPYADLLNHHLASAGIPAYGPGTSTLDRTMAGSCLLAMLDLALGGWRRDQLFDLLGRLPTAWLGHREPASSTTFLTGTQLSRWELVAMEAGVQCGLDQWSQRLRGFANRASHRASSSLPRDQATQAAKELNAFIVRLGDALKPPARASWSDLARLSVDLLELTLDATRAHESWPMPEQDAYQQVLRALDGLRVLDRAAKAGLAETAPTLGNLRSAIGSAMARWQVHTGSFGHGVLVAPMDMALGLDLEAVFALGLSETYLSRRAGQDPMISDADRLSTAGELPVRATGQREVLAWIAGAIGAANTLSVGSWPRFELGQDVRHVRCQWVWTSSSHKSLQRSALSIGDLDRSTLARWVSTNHLPEDHWLSEAKGLQRGFEMIRCRQTSTPNRYEGFVGTLALSLLPASPTLTPTAIERYARCPMSYLLGDVLGLGKPSPPEELEAIEPTERGSLIHDILRQWVAERIGGEATATRLVEIAGELFNQYEADGAARPGLPWALEKKSILRDLKEVALRDSLSPLAVEIPFGSAYGPGALRLDLSSGESVYFRGRIDRIDRRPGSDQALVVTDYKTGRRHRPEGDTDRLARGTLLQLPIYALVAAREFGNDGALYMRYWYVTARERFFEDTDRVDEALLERLGEIVTTAVSSIRNGVFPAHPGQAVPFAGTWENCRHCPFDAICPSDRDKRWKTLACSPEASGYTSLAEPPGMGLPTATTPQDEPSVG